MRIFTVSVTEQEIMIVGEALGNMPHKVVAGLIQKLQQQINEQVKANDAANGDAKPN